MISLPNPELPTRAAGYLQRWQADIDGVPDYEQRVELAKKRFPQRNKRGNATFDAVKVALTEMCQGARRCVYCEDSVADEVEHIAPKDLYPEAVFAWENYVYACGPCNGPKNSRYGVLTADDTVVEVTRKSGDPINAPILGEPALINPRREDPLSLLFLDLETMGFAAMHSVTPRQLSRVDFTLDVLRLTPGSREYLQEAWREAFEDFAAHLARYVQRRAEGAPTDELEQREKRVRSHRHPTVWHEMKRQRSRFPELVALFDAAPEALDW